MQNTKHTPGKWEIEIDWEESKEFTPSIDVYSNVNGRTRIASLNTFKYLGDYMKDEAEANARLIAAAPELLEALDGMINRFAPNFNRENDEDAKALQKAYAAIIKAKGGTL